MTNKDWTMPEWMREVCEATQVSATWHEDEINSGATLRVWSAQDTVNLLESLRAAGLLSTPAEKDSAEVDKLGYEAAIEDASKQITRLRAENERLRGRLKHIHGYLQTVPMDERGVEYIKARIVAALGEDGDE